MIPDTIGNPHVPLVSSQEAEDAAKVRSWGSLLPYCTCVLGIPRCISSDFTCVCAMGKYRNVRLAYFRVPSPHVDMSVKYCYVLARMHTHSSSIVPPRCIHSVDLAPFQLHSGSI